MSCERASEGSLPLQCSVLVLAWARGDLNHWGLAEGLGERGQRHGSTRAALAGAPLEIQASSDRGAGADLRKPGPRGTGAGHSL